MHVAFLAGPYIETAKAPRKNAKNKAAILRFKLYHAMVDEGWAVTLGEYPSLIEAAEPLLGSRNNAAFAEIGHARSRKTDAIVMLPSSPGSFSEFGAFSIIEEICAKMIIIVDKKYENEKNYLNTGPVLAALNSHAVVHFIDYEEFESCWNVVKDFMDDMRHKKAARDIVSP